MIRYKKLAGIILVVILFLIWGYFVWDMNVRYPNPEEKVLRPGEQALYQGLTLYAGDIEVYTREEFEELYEYSSGSDENGTYIVAEAVLENNTEETIALSENQPLYWVVEVGYKCHNASEYVSFQILNKEYSSITVLKPGDVMELKIPYYINPIAATYDVIRKEDIRIVYSYYPTKNYILLNGQEE